MLIGILQTGQAPDDLGEKLGDYPRLFENLLAGQGFAFRTWHVENGVFPDSVLDADGWLITGSRHGAYEDHAFIPLLENFIRDAYRDHVPVVGICFGHQIMAQALGGRVEKFSGGWAAGAQDYNFSGKTLVLNAWHQDQVVEKPADSVVIACNDFCQFAGLAYDNRALSFQPHPEFQPEFVQGLIDTRGRGRVPDTLIDRALSRMDIPIDSPVIAQQISTFFKQHQKLETA